MQLPRTKSEAILDVRYHIRLHFLHQCLYRRLRYGVAIISLLLGSSAIVSAIESRPRLVALVGCCIAIATIFDIVSQWAERGAKHDLWRREMGDLLAKSSNMTLAEIDGVLAHHEGDVDDEISALTFIAFNENVRSNGHEDWVRPLPAMSKLLRVIV